MLCDSSSSRKSDGGEGIGSEKVSRNKVEPILV